MFANILKDRVLLVEKTITQGSLGQTVTYKPVQHKYARVMPLDAQSRLRYQQLNSEVTHKVVFRGDVTISVGNYQIKHGNLTLEPVGPALLINGDTIIECKEI